MPTYVLKNVDTNEIFEKVMKISEYEIYMKENTNVIRHHDSVAPLVDPGTVGRQKPPSDFQKYIVDGIQKRNHGASPSRKYNTPKEW
jgi:hypothetical protein